VWCVTELSRNDGNHAYMCLTGILGRIKFWYQPQNSVTPGMTFDRNSYNLLVNTKIRSIHFVNIVMLCECTQCVVSVFFILLFVCMFVFSFCALPFW